MAIGSFIAILFLIVNAIISVRTIVATVYVVYLLIKALRKYLSSNCQAKCNSLVEKVNRRNKAKTFSGAIVNQIKNSIKALS